MGRPVWRSGKAGKQKDLSLIPLQLSFLFKSCRLWIYCLVTLSLTMTEILGRSVENKKKKKQIINC